MILSELLNALESDETYKNSSLVSRAKKIKNKFGIEELIIEIHNLKYVYYWAYNVATPVRNGKRPGGQFFQDKTGHPLNQTDNLCGTEIVDVASILQTGVTTFRHNTTD